MGEDRFARLTPRQQQCLRLVRELKSTKEIAAALGIKPSTVNGYLDDAISILSARDRRDAALKFAALDDADPDKFRGETIRFERVEAVPLIQFGSNDEIDRRGSEVREASASFETEPAHAPLPGLALPWSIRGSRNTLTLMQRAFWAVALTIAIVITLGTAVAAMEAISRIGLINPRR